MKKIKGVVWLSHGYAGHTLFSWFLPAAPGEIHDVYEGSLVSFLVNAGYMVWALDHQGHGQSESLNGLRAYFETFDDFPLEALNCMNAIFCGLTDIPLPPVAGLPRFIIGISLGGATAIRMAQLDPGMFRGVVLYSPMLSLERVKKETIVCGITNGALKPLVGFLNTVIPTVPIAKPAKNKMNPKAQEEMDNDPLVWHGNVRVTVAKSLSEVTDWFMEGGLAEMTVPFITLHSLKDTFTDPAGSDALMEMAKSSDKTFAKVGLGLDIDVDMWHSLTSEPGHEQVSKHTVAWLDARVGVPLS